MKKGNSKMKTPKIDLVLKDGVGILTLSNPERKNAFTLQMIDEWITALEKWRLDPQVGVIIVTGVGNDFCSGVDFASFADNRNPGPYEMKTILWEKIHRIALTLEDIDKPVIAAMKGVAVGAGLDMALMCDLRFVAETARFSEGYVKVGLVPGDGGAYFLPRLVGVSKALELLWTGDFIDAEEALRIGMVNRVYKDDELMEQTLGFAERLAQGPSAVLRTIKRATYQSSRTDLRTALDLISSHMGVIRESEDSRKAFQKATQRHMKK
jgi:enoyl-CoA hydratase/carnithine racemase